ncbi:MAG: NAD(P)(+) transhydrogenase (Re/Si-specific) subunit beta [Myxococcales bacterium]|nr:NAD(P)(+) transhydrogenase (Re/Si-specific) subunit beta [Myxococcales bacterium]
MTKVAFIELAYMVAVVLFILGLKGLAHPRTAVRGNLLGAVAMGIAIVATAFLKELNFMWVIGGALVGGGLGAIMATRVKMTAMPQLVAIFNGFGGGASVFVAAVELMQKGPQESTSALIAVGASGLIGAVTFWGSLVAYLKLEETWGGNVVYPGNKVVNVLLLVGSLALTGYIVHDPSAVWAYWVLVGLSTILGFGLVLPIGGADMPVVIALLNSYSGLAGAATGFILNNTVLIVAGSLVGASGLILTSIMCKAMNRSLANVLFATLGPSEGGPTADSVYEGKIKRTSPDELAMMLDGVRRVVFVPGYGMAVAQAQHVVRDLTHLLESRDVEVLFGVHPVAGRMPGHMNVLLAEADIDYDKLKDMDEINPMFSETDVTIVIGANDVVNPLARTDPTSPIAGMPILDVDKSRTVIVVKRSLSPGFAGIPNPLFAMDNTLMLFGDGKKALVELVNALKEN